ncbi:DUF4340 domain-containing protein [Sedimenticola sp.]|uniref:DUF4340 domain-containing protein n=1 Tax=Sedimenticola sp. TaxID=1940285 RepID=UPI003D12EEBF
MRKQSWINLFLLLLVLLLGLWVWLTPEEASNTVRTPLTQLDPAAVNSIEISNHNGPRFVMQRQGADWRMTEPYPVRANGPRIDILLDLLSTPQIEAFPLPADRLAEFGLDRPLAELTFNQTRIIFGGTHPYNYRRYLRIGDQLYLTNDIFPHHALARAEEFVSHALFAEVETIEAIQTPTWRLTRQPDGWAMQPEAPGVDVAQLAEKVADWQHTWVAKVIQAPATPSDQNVTIHLANRAEPLVLEVVNNKKQILLVNRPLGLAYQLNNDSLLQPPANRD